MSIIASAQRSLYSKPIVRRLEEMRALAQKGNTILATAVARVEPLLEQFEATGDMTCIQKAADIARNAESASRHKTNVENQAFVVNHEGRKVRSFGEEHKRRAQTMSSPFPFN
jgi:CMP-2-keto-3-deoxyoctulosonic acid synthetase